MASCKNCNVHICTYACATAHVFLPWALMHAFKLVHAYISIRIVMNTIITIQTQAYIAVEIVTCVHHGYYIHESQALWLTNFKGWYSRTDYHNTWMRHIWVSL